MLTAIVPGAIVLEMVLVIEKVLLECRLGIRHVAQSAELQGQLKHVDIIDVMSWQINMDNEGVLSWPRSTGNR